MRKFLFILAIYLPTVLIAQNDILPTDSILVNDTISIDSMHITLIMDDMLQQRIEPLLDVPVYAISEPPFWKVRIGNFKTREEANTYKDILLNMFPDMVGSTYVVPDKITITQ